MNRPRYPGERNYSPGVKRWWAIERYATALEVHKFEHPATQAALGRLWYHRKRVPQDGVRRVAWNRESGWAPGHMNRSMRRHLNTNQGQAA